MKIFKLNVLIIICIFLVKINSAQSTFEFYLLNSFITEENPPQLSVSFLTTQKSKSSIIIIGTGKFPVSQKLSTRHNFKISLNKINVKKNIVYFLEGVNAQGKTFRSDTFYVDLPEAQFKNIPQEKNILPIVYLGVLTFFTPMPGILNGNGINKIVTLNKELPIIAFGGSEGKYPFLFLSFEYSYLLNKNLKNLGSIGLNYLIPIKYLEYISTGIALTTDFNNNLGISPDLALGLFNVYNAFTVYVKYKFDYFKAKSIPYYHEIKLGLYAKFFSINF